MVRWSGITILFVAVTLAALLLPGTATANYVVNPMTTEYPSEAKDVEENTFQDLPLRVMLLYCMLVVLPACFYPGELFYLLSILLPFGFRRVMRHNVLDDDFRRDLYRRITDRPGTSTRELGELTGASRGGSGITSIYSSGKARWQRWTTGAAPGTLRGTSGTPNSRSTFSSACGKNPAKRSSGAFSDPRT